MHENAGPGSMFRADIIFENIRNRIRGEEGIYVGDPGSRGERGSFTTAVLDVSTVYVIIGYDT